jgi:glutamate N-acetyltransferase/amino-acid N-acetyltransferase
LSYEVILEGSVTSPTGFVAAATFCGLKESGNQDLAVICSEKDCAAGGVFTRNQVAAAPVILDRAVLSSGGEQIRGIVANAGNANACTGEAGLAAARKTQEEAAVLLNCRPEQILVLSTGVIGQQLPVSKIAKGLRIVTKELTDDGGMQLAQGRLHCLRAR